ncbi:hypothetical protein C0989_001821 [Termitomyces sp. Mn162]|nr:hypothetical protein C0989_001821 [Termitomyces sp. Mn162]
MDLISQSLQALLECLSPNSAPSMAEEPALPAMAPAPAAPVTLQPQISHPALPDAYNGAHSGREQFLQSCLTYIHLKNETAFSDALHSETEESQSPLPDIQTLTPEPPPSSPTPPKVQQRSPA